MVFLKAHAYAGKATAPDFDLDLDYLNDRDHWREE